MFRIFYGVCIFLFLNVTCCAAAENKPLPAITQSISTAELIGYADYPSHVKQLISEAFLLSEKNLTYLYGSSDPKNGGMDCSGTIYYLLKNGIHSNAPRDANGMYHWVKSDGKIYYVTHNDFHSDAFNELKPGDLLFWSGTYETHAVHAITHVMLYLGKNKNHEPLMFGSSDGRTYRGVKMRGVSVFDFKLPKEKDKARFVAYGCIPSFTC